MNITERRNRSEEVHGAALQGSVLVRRRAWPLAAGVTLLLLSFFSAHAQAASKPAHNHYMTFTPQPEFATYTTWSVQADLYDRNGNRVYHWETGSRTSSKAVKWGFYNGDPKAWLHMWVRTGNGRVHEFLGKTATCDQDITFNGARGGSTHELRYCDWYPPGY